MTGDEVEERTRYRHSRGVPADQLRVSPNPDSWRAPKRHGSEDAIGGGIAEISFLSSSIVGQASRTENETAPILRPSVYDAEFETTLVVEPRIPRKK
jgi:hypothetical protein